MAGQEWPRGRPVGRKESEEGGREEHLLRYVDSKLGQYTSGNETARQLTLGALWPVA